MSPKTENISRARRGWDANTLRLEPRLMAARLLSSPRDMLRADAPLRGLEVLVVEDEPPARDVLQQALEFFGAGVAVAGSVEDARERIQAVPPDVVVTDIELGRETGFDLVAWLRTQPSASINR